MDYIKKVDVLGPKKLKKRRAERIDYFGHIGSKKRTEAIKTYLHDVIVSDEVREKMQPLILMARKGYVNLHKITKHINRDISRLRDAKTSLAARLNGDDTDINWDAVEYCVRKGYLFRVTEDIFVPALPIA